MLFAHILHSFKRLLINTTKSPLKAFPYAGAKTETAHLLSECSQGFPDAIEQNIAISLLAPNYRDFAHTQNVQITIHALTRFHNVRESQCYD